MQAYIAQAAAAHLATNCATESEGLQLFYGQNLTEISKVLFEQALKQAEELDAEYARSGRVRGPLHGVPFSAKVVLPFSDFD